MYLKSYNNKKDTVKTSPKKTKLKGIIKLCKQCFMTVVKYGNPEIVNSDQGNRFTCMDWTETLKNISMDGKGRALDNISIESFRRAVKKRLCLPQTCR